MTTETLPAPTRSVDQVLADLAEHGYGILEGVATAARLALVRDRLVEVAAEERAAGTDVSYHRAANQRVYGLLAHDACFVDVAIDPTALAVVDRTIGPDAILSNLSANIAGPGGRMQTIHADQGFLPEPWHDPWAVQVMWLLDEFTAENGATRVVPGSHLRQGQPARAVAYRDTVPVCGPAGSLAVFDARVWHGTGVNTLEGGDPAERRHALLAFYCRPFLRGQENWGLSLDPAVYRGRPDLAALLGITSWQHLGLVNGGDADIGS